MPALFTSASIDLKRDSAVSTILAAVAGSPMSPSTRATLSEAATSADWLTFRELAPTLKPRSTNPFTIPAPIPCEAPVTMAVFRWLLMVAYLQNACPRKQRGLVGSATKPAPYFKPGTSIPQLTSVAERLKVSRARPRASLRPRRSPDVGCSKWLGTPAKATEEWDTLTLCPGHPP